MSGEGEPEVELGQMTSAGHISVSILSVRVGVDHKASKSTNNGQNGNIVSGHYLDVDS